MRRKLISIFLIIALVQYFYGFVFAENLTNEEQNNQQIINQNQQELNEKQEAINKQINEVNTKLEYVQSELSSTMIRVQELEDKVIQYQSEMKNLSDKLDTLQTSIDKAKQELTVMQADYNEKERLLRERLVAMYEDGETTYLDILLSSRNIIEFISGYYFINEMVEYDNKLIEEVEKKKNDMEIINKKLEKEETELKVLKAKREQTTIVLQNTITLQSSYAEELSNQEKELQKQITEYKLEQAKIELLIRNISNNNGDLNIQYTEGIMLWPVAISGTGIVSGFGIREHPIQGVIKQHTGIDIGDAPFGSPIVAAADGVVTYAGWLGGYGNCVIINHGNGISTLYGHGQKIITELHKEVKQGDLIMEVGSTGNSTGPHLHFEVRINGSCVDPLNYVVAP